MSSWEDRMAAKAAARRPPVPEFWPAIPAVLAAELPPGEKDTARNWCTSCGLPDPPVAGWCEPNVPCPRCGSEWRWYGRLADRDGTAADAPDDGTCRDCYEWRRYPAGQEHFGWAWWRICAHDCPCAHHASEIWMA